MNQEPLKNKWLSKLVFAIGVFLISLLPNRRAQMTEQLDDGQPKEEQVEIVQPSFPPTVDPVTPLTPEEKRKTWRNLIIAAVLLAAVLALAYCTDGFEKNPLSRATAPIKAQTPTAIPTRTTAPANTPAKAVAAPTFTPTGVVTPTVTPIATEAVMIVFVTSTHSSPISSTLVITTADQITKASLEALRNSLASQQTLSATVTSSVALRVQSTSTITIGWTLQPGTIVSAVGRSPDNKQTFVCVMCDKSLNDSGWITTTQLNIQGDVKTLPQVHD